METKAYMYVLECADGSLYTGYTTDVEKRLKTHNAGKGAKYTRARLPVKLLYKESYPDKPTAMSAEALFKKKSRQAKLNYIKKREWEKWGMSGEKIHKKMGIPFQITSIFPKKQFCFTPNSGFLYCFRFIPSHTREHGYPKRKHKS